MDREHWATRGPKELGKAPEKAMKMYISRKLFFRKYLNFTLTYCAPEIIDNNDQQDLF